MEISSITGPDYMPTGFSVEQPRSEEAAERRREEVRPAQERPADQQGSVIDTYA